jgi:uncharacterized membrane protein
MKKLPFYIYVFLLGIAASQAIYYYFIMPDWMASHFAGSGKADNWMSKNSFYIFEICVFLLMSGIFLVMPWAFEKFKLKKMNLPNREYWLSPERIDEVYSYFRESFCWYGVAHLIFLIGVMQLVFNANIDPNPVLNNGIFLTLLGIYLVFSLIWVIMFYHKFKNVG